MKILLSTFSLLFVASASAHTGMEQLSFLHNTIHIMTAVGIYLAIIGAGFYLLSKLPKAKRQHVKIKK